MTNYDNLSERLEQAKKEEVERGNPFRLPNGKYNAKLKDIGSELSQNKNDMFVVKLKIRSKKYEELHGKTITIRFVKNVTFQFDRFLLFMDMLGVDLSKIKSDKDWPKIFSDIEDDGPMVHVEIVRDEKNPQFENAYIRSVDGDEEEDIDMSTGTLEDNSDDAAAPLKDENGDDIPF